jgi:alginate O-acetyltransferase complex protein AlgI
VHKLMLERRGRDTVPRGGLPRAVLSWGVTFVFVLVTWVFFRAQDFGVAWTYLGKMAFLDPGGMNWTYVNAVTVMVLGALLHLWVRLRGERELRPNLQRPVAWTGLAAALLLVLVFAPFDANPFIYFQF